MLKYVFKVKPLKNIAKNKAENVGKEDPLTTTPLMDVDPIYDNHTNEKGETPKDVEPTIVNNVTMENEVRKPMGNTGPNNNNGLFTPTLLLLSLLSKQKLEAFMRKKNASLWHGLHYDCPESPPLEAPSCD